MRNSWRLIKSKFPGLAAFIFLLVQVLKAVNVYLRCRIFSVNVFNKRILENRVNSKAGDVYVLGCGGTAINLSEEELSIISKGYSISFNFWIYHDFVPDCYVFEIKPNDNTPFLKFCDLLKIKGEDYKDVIFIFKDMEVNASGCRTLVENFPSELLKNVYVSLDIQLASGDDDIFERSLIQFSKLFWKSTSLIPKCRGSLSYCVALAAYYCNKKIVLCGIDLNNAGAHLAMQYESSIEKYKALPRLSSSRQENNRMHSTNDPEFGLPIISDVLSLYQDYLINGSSLTVNNQDVGLNDDILYMPILKSVGVSR